MHNLRSLKKNSSPNYGPKSPDYCRNIPRHQYSEFVVRFAVSLRCETNCSTRDIVTAIKKLEELTEGLVDKVPSYNTIDYWTRKCGLDEMIHAPEALKDMSYAAVIDECMMIGSEKLLPVLAIPAEHQGHPVQLSDVKVIGLNVRPGWNADMVAETLEANIESIGTRPKYVITDNDSKMCRAVKQAGYKRHRDIGHTLAMFMERTYKKEAEFVDFNNMMVTCKQQHCMKEIAYLQSPSQRTKARFMNLSESVAWANVMLNLFHTLTPGERAVFSFIPEYSSLIEELNEMVSCIHYVETEMKYHGLSKRTITDCKRHICATVMQGNERMRKTGQQILDYLAEENLLLDNKEVVNNSSDIIESTFGIFKYKQSPNKLNGVTTLVLHLPVILAFAGRSASKNYNIIERLCRTKIKDIIQWRDENLSENLVTKRIKKLAAA